MARVTGIGGIFIRARDSKSLAAWYAQHLGIQLTDWGGAQFLWADEVPPTSGSTAWSVFPADTEYFGSGQQPYMVNYRVDDLDALLAQLEAAGVPIDPRRENYSYGKFAWITDPEGNRVELWQPLVLPAEDAPS